MQEKLIRILKKILLKVIGPNGEKLIDILYGKQKVNEFIISEKLGLTINQTRNVLYKLADEGLVEFTRKKDKKKGGWYIYFWTLKVKRILQKSQEETLHEIRRLKEESQTRKKERYYYSPSIEVEYSEEEALQNNFICPETGEVLILRDTSQMQEGILKEIKKLEEVLEEINKEIVVIEEKEEKVSQKKRREEEKEKDLERKRKKAERDKEKAKIQKEEKKKKPLKKPKDKKKAKKK